MSCFECMLCCCNEVVYLMIGGFVNGQASFNSGYSPIIVRIKCSLHFDVHQKRYLKYLFHQCERCGVEGRLLSTPGSLAYGDGLKKKA